MPKEYTTAESIEAIAQAILPTFHAELATARIQYVFVDKASMKNGRPILGKARKVSGVFEYLLEKDFLIEIALDQWNPLTDTQRRALVDHLMEYCTGEEDDEEGGSGEMVWKMREPDVKEFATILNRHGAWNDALTGFVQVAQRIQIDARIQEVADASAAEGVQVHN